MDFEFAVSDGPDKGAAWSFPGPHFYVGSGDDCHLQLPAALVQPRHAEVRVDARGVPWIRDLTGSGLVAVNGQPVKEAALRSGEFVRLGGLELVVRARGGAGSDTLLRPSGASSNVALEATARRPTPFAKSVAQVDAGAELETGTEATTLSTILPPGSIIDGRYEIVDKLAAGGMGEVYKALHVELGKPMALKVMLPELSADREFVARFKREAIAASRIGQQNIIDVSDFGQTPNGRFYFVMEFLDGLTLASVSHREGALSAQRAVAITAQVARALAAAHAQGIVHRDLKPENIMLLQRPGQRDFVKVLDFGVAKVATGRGEGGHTAVGMVVGTPQYMSPEQARAVPVDARSDIYALGLILYELLAGRPTFSAETPSMLMVKHVTEPPPPLPPGDTPVELSELIFQMLEKDPDARPQTMEAVLEVLDMLEARLKANDPQLKRLSGDYVRAATPTKTAGVGLPRATGTTPGVASAAAVPPSRSRVPALLFGIVAVLALALVAVVAIDRDTPEPLVVEKRVVVEKPGSPPPIEKVKLIFAAQPEIVEVYEDDVLLGTTPYTAVREAGAVAELTFVAKGYMPLMRKVKFETEQLLTVTLEKEKKAGPSPSPKKQPKENPGAIKDLKDAPF